MKLGLTAKSIVALASTITILFLAAGMVQVAFQRAALDELLSNSQDVVSLLNNIQEQAGRESETLKAERTTELLAAIAPPAIASFEFSLLATYADVAVKDPDISYVEFQTPDGESIARAGDKKEVPADGILTTDIAYDGSVLGKVLLGYNHNRLQAVLKTVAEMQEDGRKAMAEAESTALTGAMLNTAAMVAIAGLIGSVMAWLSMRQLVLRPLAATKTAMDRLAAGDKDTEIPMLSRADEIGAMARSVQVFKENAQRMESMEAERHEQERRVEEEKRHAMAALADNFESSVRGVVQSLVGAASAMRGASEEMSGSAVETSAQSQEAAAAAEQASANVQTVAAAADEMSRSIAEIGQQVGQASTVAASAVNEAERANATVQGLATAADKIGEVVRLISDIAEQTNLLALNATIEAARAGEAGKGFAVVASEVKNLANQTARATEDIAAQVSSIQAVSSDAVQALAGIGGTITEIDQIAATIASAMEEQGAATQEIARNVQQAAAGTERISGNIAVATRSASRTGEVSSSIQDEVGRLTGQMDSLSREVEGFLSHIRQA